MNATINFEIREQKADANGDCPIYLRVTYDRKPAWLSVGFKVKSTDWNRDKQKVRRSNHRYDVLNEELLKLHSNAQDAIIELKALDKLNSKRVIELLKGYDKKDFFTYAQNYIQDHIDKGSIRLAKNTKVIVNQIREFTNRKTLPISEIDRDFIERFSTYLRNKDKPNSSNTIRKKFIRLSHLLKRAKKDGFLSENPFEDYKLPSYQRPKKDAITIEQIRDIEKLDLIEGSTKWNTRNYFLFSFYNAGIRFGDLCRLKKENIIDSRLKYLMSKTSSNTEPKWKNIKLRKESWDILHLYDYEQKKESDYLFPILNTEKNLNDPLTFDREKQSKNAIANNDLKDIAKEAGIEQKLSTHIARHSFANYALKQGVSLYSISKALAHSDLETTQAYLNAFDEEKLDNEMDELFGS